MIAPYELDQSVHVAIYALGRWYFAAHLVQNWPSRHVAPPYHAVANGAKRTL